METVYALAVVAAISANAGVIWNTGAYHGSGRASRSGKYLLALRHAGRGKEGKWKIEPATEPLLDSVLTQLIG